MGLPNINIVFKTQGISSVKRSEKGIVALILKDSTELGGHTANNALEIPAGLDAINQAYVRLAFVGYINPPRRVLLYVMDGTIKKLTDALEYFQTQEFDYLVGMPDLTAEEAKEIASWVTSERQSDHMVKAVLPVTSTDNEGIINFTATGMISGKESYDTAEYCSRIAGIIAGTPMTISCTYAVLPELSQVKRLTKTALDAAIDKGELVLVHDGEKVKIGRGVNSLTSTTQDKGEAFRKIKIVEAVDMMRKDIRMTAQDSYIGKYANSYDNKCLLIMAIKGYLEELERAGILANSTSVVEIDMASQEGYLKSSGIDTTKMSDQAIKEANTGSKVFLRAKVSILDAIEDIDLNIAM